MAGALHNKVIFVRSIYTHPHQSRQEKADLRNKGNDHKRYQQGDNQGNQIFEKALEGGASDFSTDLGTHSHSWIA